ncbi:MAG: glycosyltransferase family 25 protein [Gemmataceae bacterium]
MFETICCINLLRRQDRWEDFRSRLPGDWPFSEVTRFPATDGQLCAPPDWWAESAGAWGCYRSHLRIIEECLNSGIESVLIFEDDAIFPENLASETQTFMQNLPDDWQMIYLGGQLLREGFRPPERINEWVYKPYNVNRTHAYAVRGKEMLSVLYKHLLSNNWYPRHHIDHHYGRLHQAGQYQVYVPRHWIVGQLGGPSDVSNQQTETTFWNHAEEVWKRGPEPLVIVVGLHESAASRVSLALHHLGVYMGSNLEGAANQLDAEDQALAQLCEWAAPFPQTQFKLVEPVLRDRLEDWLGNHMWQARLTNKLAGGKYPLLCALGRYLHEFCGQRLRVIDVREPTESLVTSLQLRLRKVPNASFDSDAQAVQVQHWLMSEKERFLAMAPHLSLPVVQLTNDPVGTVQSITSYLGLSPSADQKDNAAKALQAMA